MKDRNGDFRKECSQCSCKEYVYEIETVKCAFCGDFPTYHTLYGNQQHNNNNSIQDTVTKADIPEADIHEDNHDKQIDHLQVNQKKIITTMALKKLYTFLKNLESKEDGEAYEVINSQKDSSVIICHNCRVKIILGDF